MSSAPACELIDHTFEVVVAGGAGLRATQGAVGGGPDDRLHHKVFATRSDTVVERLGPTMARTIDAGRRVSSRLFLTSTFALPRLHRAAGPIVWPPRPSSGATNEGLACPLNNVRCKRSCYPWLSCCLNLLRESRDQANPAWFPVGIQAVLAGCEVWVMTIAIAKAPDETADITSGNDPDLPASLLSFILVAKFLGVPADAGQIAHDHGSPGERYQLEDLARIAKRLKIVAKVKPAATEALHKVPLPALAELEGGEAVVLLKIDQQPAGSRFLIQRGNGGRPEVWSADDFGGRYAGRLLLMTTRELMAGATRPFDISWFIPALVKYRGPLRDVLIGSFFLQLMGLISPIFFQLVIDKVLVHQSLTTLDVLAVGLSAVLIFETGLSALRNWLFAHTTNRVDSELSAQLFRHLLNLPLSYFEARRVGDSVARVRELDRIREFLTSNAVTVVIDLFFTIVFFGVMYAYSPLLTLVVTLSIPLYVAISVIVTPPLRARLDEKFKRGAENQSFLVESVTGIGTLKAMAAVDNLTGREGQSTRFARRCTWHRGESLRAVCRGGNVEGQRLPQHRGVDHRAYQ